MNDKPIIGRYARIIMDDWFKRTFGTEPNKGLLIMLLKELIPEHDIKGLTYVQQEHLTDRPEELKEEIFKRLFKTAEIATFTPEERIKYENDMTTERDIQNYISYAREKGLEEGRMESARNMLAEGFGEDLVARCTGLSIEQVKELKL